LRLAVVFCNLERHLHAKETARVNFRELLQLPNLLSLSRIPLGLATGYFLWRDDGRSTLIAAVLLTLAGITDGLDGYLARRRGQITKLGIVLDPIADKIFAGILVIFLIWLRGFPIWLAAAVIGRDLLIMLGGLVLIDTKKVTLPSNLTGKHAFAWLAVLLASYVTRFEFGIELITPLVVLLLAASTISYIRVFYLIRKGVTPAPFVDRPWTKITRLCYVWAVSVVYLFRFYTDVLR